MLAIFDLDGTLVDSRSDLAAAGNAARGALGLPALPEAAVTAMIGEGAGKLIERLVPDGDRDDRAMAMEAFRCSYAAHLTDRTRAYPGITDLLAQVRAAGWHIAVATNKPAAFAQPILDRLGLPCDALRGGDQTKKPDPTMLMELMEVLASPPAATWMIGDHHTDLLAARAAGVRSVHCTWGFGRRDDAPADLVAGLPHDVLRILHA